MGEEGKNDWLLQSSSHQSICLTGRERAYTIHNYEVVVHASSSASLDSCAPGSNRVQVSTITNQNWELPAHPGHMVASNSNYIAYVIEGRSGYVLRLIHRQINSRTLLKGFTGAILDVGFAPGSSSLLASVDQGGNLFVWDLSKTDTLSEAQSDVCEVDDKRQANSDSGHTQLERKQHQILHSARERPSGHTLG